MNRGAGRLAVAAVGLACLLAGWILGSPVGSSPDEAAHLIKGVATAEGHLHGADASAAYPGGGLDTAFARRFPVPPALAVADVPPCYATAPDLTAACGPSLTATHAATAVSHLGGYFPPAYLPLGLAERTQSDPDAAVLAGRATGAALCLLLLLLAFGCLRTRWERLGWLCALTPVTLWTAASAATNGLEVCAGICLVSALCRERVPVGEVRTAGDAGGRRRLGCVAWVAGATTLAIAKAAGPVWLVALLVLSAIALHGSPLPAFRGRWRLLIALPVVGSVANLAWSAVAATNRVPQRPAALLPSILRSEHLTAYRAVPQMFTGFGWEDTQVPGHLWALGAAGVAGYLLVSLLVAGRSGRAAIVTAAAVFWAATVAFTLMEVRGHFGLQARYTVVLFATIPLVALLGRRADGARVRLPAVVPLALATLWAAGALLASLTNLRRYTVGLHGSLLLSSPSWSPPGGVDLTVGLLVVGVLLLVGVTLHRPRSFEVADVPLLAATRTVAAPAV